MWRRTTLSLCAALLGCGARNSPRVTFELPIGNQTFSETGIGRHCLRFMSRCSADTVGRALPSADTASATNRGRVTFSASFD